jgi:hypothetical protein
MSATFLNSVFNAMGFGLPFRHRKRSGAAIDLLRLSAHDLADLNLPADIRARVDVRREGGYLERLGGWRGI